MIQRFLDLGFTPLADNFLTALQLNEPEKYYPLNVCLCKNCGLIQLGYIVSPEEMYHQGYLYESSITKTGTEHFVNMAKKICERFQLKKQSLIVDIGSNVGVLLKGFKKQKMKVIGVEPSKKIAHIANKNGIKTLSKFFDYKMVEEIKKKYGHPSVITATNVFAHISDLHTFIKNIKKLLPKNGIFILEAPYFVNLFEKLEYDTIYHEHMAYLSIKPLVNFFEKHGMELFDVERFTIHGGSIRCFVSYKDQQKISPVIQELLDLEGKKQIYSIKRLKRFADDVKKHRIELTHLLNKLKQKGKRIVCISASAKGMTLLNYNNIDNFICEYVTEKSKLKIGRFTPGTHIPIRPDSFLIKDKPDYAMLLAWNFADEIIQNNKKFQQIGGKFIIPIPHPKIV